MSELNNKIISATKWSTVTEFVAKLVSPITTMVLARLLTPEAFGVVATITMIISFAEIFTDAGFQRYIIQHDFIDEEDKYRSISVAFTYNLIMSLLLWVIIIVFREPLATLVGNPGLGNVVMVACASIPLAAFSSIQMAILKRKFDFKTLFIVKLACVLVPIFVTIPLAFYFRNYWALVLGSLFGNFLQAILLTIYSKWKPVLCFSIEKLKLMFSFCGWTIVDTILTWCTWYLDVFFIGVLLNDYYLGLYKTSMTTVSHIMGLVYSSIFPVVIPALSRLQSDISAMNITLLKFQKYLSIFILPLGFLLFLFQDTVTQVLLGEQWCEAAPFIGLWAIIDVFVVLLTRFPGSAFVAIGKPRVSVLDNFLHIIVLIPAIIIAAHYDFRTLYLTRSFVRIEGIVVALILSRIVLDLKPLRMIFNILPECVACLAMTAAALLLLRIGDSFALSVVWAICCLGIYVLILSLFKQDKLMMKRLYYSSIHRLVKRINKKDA